MSGGYYDYKFNRADDLANEIEADLEGDVSELGTALGEEARLTVNLLRLSAKLARHLEWFMSGDYGDNTARERFAETFGGAEAYVTLAQLTKALKNP